MGVRNQKQKKKPDKLKIAIFENKMFLGVFHTTDIKNMLSDMIFGISFNFLRFDDR